MTKKGSKSSKVHKASKKVLDNNPWKVSTFVLAVLLLIAIFNGGFDFNKAVKTVEPAQAPADDEPGAVAAGTDVVSIIEYSDFECPFCGRVFPTMEKIKETYGDKVSIEFKQFPLSFHSNAKKAAEASECARDQGKFWEMHDELFANQRALGVADLKKYAGKIGLDQAKFDACLDNGDMAAKVDADIAEGKSLGVSGTPATFINGKMLSGAQPFEAFKAEIDAALSGEAVPAAPTQPAEPEVDTSNDPEITMTIVNDPGCSACDTSRIKQVTGELFPTIKYVEVDYNTEEGKKLIEEMDGQALPTYAFDSAVKDAANFQKAATAMVQKGDYYVLLPAAVGAGKYLNPPDADDDAVKGDADAPVTIIEFSDFECPFCGKFYSEILPKIESEYVDTGKVKLVHRDFPLGFHANAQKAAEASECARDQGKFWEMHDKMYENQRSLGVDNLKKWAGDLGLDTAAFNDCLDSGKYEQEVKDDLADGQNVGISGTPGFFVNGVKVSGAQPFENFKQIIDAELGN